MKELCPNCLVVGADPEGSILAQPENLNETDTSFYEVEGIGYDFVPTVLDRKCVDKWYKINDKESLPLARRLIRDEGLLCGGSSGAALSATIKAAKDLKEGQRCVVILPDGVRNYMTKFLSDQWMEARNLKECENLQEHWWWNEKVSKLTLDEPLIVSPTTTCSRALNVMKKHGFDQLPVIDKNGYDSYKNVVEFNQISEDFVRIQANFGRYLVEIVFFCRILVGMVTLTNLMSTIVKGKIQPNDPVNGAMMKQFSRVTKESSLGLISRILEKDSFVVVVDKDKGKNVSRWTSLRRLLSDVFAKAPLRRL